MLIIQLSSLGNNTTVVTMERNNIVRLTAVGEATVRASSFLLLATGGACCGNSLLFTNPLRGPDHDPFVIGFFSFGSGADPLTRGFLLHPAISLTSFCTI
jgi:hypothetical protein